MYVTCDVLGLLWMMQKDSRIYKYFAPKIVAMLPTIKILYLPYQNFEYFEKSKVRVKGSMLWLYDSRVSFVKVRPQPGGMRRGHYDVNLLYIS